MALPAFQTLGAQLVVTGTSITPAMPSGIAAGDTLIVITFNQANGTVWGATPSGWNLGDSLSTGNVSGVWYWKDAVGGDTSPTITWTGSQISNSQVIRFNGSSNSASPIGNISHAFANSSSVVDVPGITSSSANSLMVYLVCAGGNSQAMGPGPTYTLIAQVGRNGNGNTCWVDGAVVISGATSVDCSFGIANASWTGFGLEIVGSGGTGLANIRGTSVVQQVLETYSTPKNVRATGVVLQVLRTVAGASAPTFDFTNTSFEPLRRGGRTSRAYSTLTLGADFVVAPPPIPPPIVAPGWVTIQC